MTQEIVFTYTYQLTTPAGHLIEGGSNLELLVDEEVPLTLVDAYSIGFETAVSELEPLLSEIYQPGETEFTLTIQNLTLR